MLAVGGAGWQAWGRRRSSAAGASSGPRVAARRLRLLLLPRLLPHGPWRGGSSRPPNLRAPVPGRVTAASRPTSSAPIGCREHLQRRVVASGPGRGGAAAAPSRAGKEAGDAKKSPTAGHLPARPPRREPVRGREALSRRSPSRVAAPCPGGAQGGSAEHEEGPARRGRDERPGRTRWNRGSPAGRSLSQN